MIEININKDKLIELINKHTVVVSFNGFVPFTHKVVNARKLFEELHEVADCDKDTLVDFVRCMNAPKTFMDREKYKPNQTIKCLFANITFQGVFRIAGHEALGNDPYIEISKIAPIIGFPAEIPVIVQTIEE